VAILVTEQGIVHYEVYGRGRPVLFLHGWLGSWALWRSTIGELSKEFRTFALDFWGFGESTNQGADYSVDNFVVLVNEFMDRLGIVKAPLVGHSMGGTVSLGAAIRYPEKVVKVVVVGSPIHGSSLRQPLKLAAYSGWQSLSQSSPFLFETFMRGLRTAMPIYSRFLANDGAGLWKMMERDLDGLTGGPFFQSIGTLRRTDLRSRVGEIKMPLLGIYGRKDRIVHPDQRHVLKQYAPQSRIAWFEKSGHFPMMDEPQRFHETIRQFLNNG
jgi:pimeloyl-ACP methyl ester carboxylesterase